MKITVLAIGRLKEAHFRAAQREYLERLQHYAKIEVRELEEGSDLQSHLGPRTKLVLLDERGTDLDSPSWASQIIGEAEMRHGSQTLVFAIGGADGHSEALRAQAWKIVAFGRATLAHRLARIVLLEQIYRAFTILRGLPYHRA
jgi:23S rRNA (pseudouridine1915-N3)-methyltransferase